MAPDKQHLASRPSIDAKRIYLDFQRRTDDGETIEFGTLCSEHSELRGELERLHNGQGLLDSVPASTLEPGTVIGDYEIEREIGRGGMGVVLLCNQISLKRRVALKVISAAGALDEQAVARFRREVELLAKLEHPGIISLIDADEVDGRAFLVMEYIPSANLAEAIALLADGKDLKDLTRADLEGALGIQPRSESDTHEQPAWMRRAPDDGYVGFVVEIFARLADALEFAHLRGVLHRDVKPSNVLIDAQGHARLVDFGLSCLTKGSGYTQVGRLVGTPVYMSPEQLLAGQLPLDRRTDIYSLGASLFEVLTLSRPFNASSMPELIRCIQWDDVPSIRAVNSAVPRDLERIVQTAVAKNPDHRYDSAADMAADLRRVLNYDAVSAKGTPPWSRMSRRIRKHRLGVSIGAVAAVVLLIAGLRSFSQWSTQQSQVDASERVRADRVSSSLGRLTGALQAGDVAGATGAWDALTTIEVDREAAGEIGVLEGRFRALVTQRLDETDRLLDQDPVAAVAILEQLERSPFFGQEIGDSLAAARAAAAASKELRFLSDDDPAVRVVGLRHLRADLRAGAEIAPSRLGALRDILEQEGANDVLGAALLLVFDVDLHEHDELLRQRFQSAPAEVARAIAIVPALRVDRSWLPLLKSRAAEIVVPGRRTGFFHDWDRHIARFLGKPRIKEPFKAFTDWCYWDRHWEVGFSGGGSGRESAAGEYLAFLLQLGDPDVHEEAFRLLRSSGDDRAIALDLLLEIDDPRDGDRLAEAREDYGGRWSSWDDRRVALMLMRWQHPQALSAFTACLAEEDRDLPAIAYEFAVHCYEQAAARDWLVEYLSDPLSSGTVQRWLWLGLTYSGGSRWWMGRDPRINSRRGPSAYHYRQMMLQRDRVESVRELRDQISESMRGRYDLPAEWPAEVSWGRDRSLGQLAEDHAWRLAGLEDARSAEELFTMLTDPRMPVVRVAALALAHRGDGRRVLTELLECAEAYPDDPVLQRELALLELSRGKTDAARARITAWTERWRLPAGFLAGDRYSALRDLVPSGASEDDGK